MLHPYCPQLPQALDLAKQLLEALGNYTLKVTRGVEYLVVLLTS